MLLKRLSTTAVIVVAADLFVIRIGLQGDSRGFELHQASFLLAFLHFPLCGSIFDVRGSVVESCSLILNSLGVPPSIG